MSLFHKSKRKIISRSYDISSASFSPISSRLPSNISDNTKFTWTVSLTKDLLALFFSMILSSIGYGILMVMIAMRLEEFVKNEVLISVSSATQIVAGIIFARYLPAMGRKIGITNSYHIGVILSVVSILLMSLYVNFTLWLIVTFIYGMGAFVVGVTRQAIMFEIAPKHMRALIISISGMSIALCNSFGPIILQSLQTRDSFATFVIAALFFLASMLPIIRLKKVETHLREEKQISVWHYIFTSPKIMFAGFATNYMVSSIGAFAIIYGIQIGMTKEDASMLLSTFLLGSLFSIPISYLTNILNRRLMIIAFAATALSCIFSVYHISNPLELHASLFAIFVCSIGIKLPAVVLINEKYKPTKRLAVNSTFSKFCLIGNVFGIFVTGAAMKVFGPQGLWLSSMLVLGLFLFFCFLNYAGKFWRGDLSAKDFSIFNKLIRDDQLL